MITLETETRLKESGSQTKTNTNILKTEKMERPLDQDPDFKQILAEATEEVQNRMNDGEEYSYNDIEEIMLSHGLEMDYVEDMLF